MPAILAKPIRSLKFALIASTCFAMLGAVHAHANTTAITAHQFLDSLGVNTHFNYTWSSNAYSKVSMMEAELNYVGIKYARDTAAQQSFVTMLQKVHNDTGVKYDILVDTNLPWQMQVFQSNASMIAEVEGPNEIDNWPVSYNGQWGYPAAVSMQKQFYWDMKNTPGLQNIPVDSLTIANANYLPQVGNLAPYCDYVGSHIYPQFGGNATPTNNLQWSINMNGQMAPGKPPVVTEFGWWTLPQGGGVPEDVHAKYTLNYFFDAILQGVHRSYFYELNDEYYDPNGTTIEDHFGLFQANGTPKKAANALYFMTRLLADPTPTAHPGSLPLTVSTSNGANVSKLLMQRGDGTYILALWQDAWIWDVNSNQRVSVPNQQVLVNFGITGKTVKVYDPLIGQNATSTHYNIGGMTQLVPDHPVFIFITP